MGDRASAPWDKSFAQFFKFSCEMQNQDWCAPIGFGLDEIRQFPLFAQAIGRGHAVFHAELSIDSLKKPDTASILRRN